MSCREGPKKRCFLQWRCMITNKSVTRPLSININTNITASQRASNTNKTPRCPEASLRTRRVLTRRKILTPLTPLTPRIRTKLQQNQKRHSSSNSSSNQLHRRQSKARRVRDELILILDAVKRYKYDIHLPHPVCPSLSTSKPLPELLAVILPISPM